MLLGICGLCSRVEAVELDLTASVCQLLHFTLPTVTVESVAAIVIIYMMKATQLSVFTQHVVFSNCSCCSKNSRVHVFKCRQ